MRPLAARLAQVLRSCGFDPSAHQADLHALDALEARSPVEAAARYRELKRGAVAARRDLLARELAQHPFVADPPGPAWPDASLADLERDVARLARHVHEARTVRERVEEARRLRASLAWRRVPWDDPTTTPVPCAALGLAAKRAEEARRLVAREARVEEEARAALAESRRLATPVEVPDVTDLPADEALARLAAVSARIARRASAEAAHAAVARVLRDPAIARWRHASRKRLAQAAAEALAAEDEGALRALAEEAERLREASAQADRQSRRATRRGGKTPRPEPRPGDPVDPYG